MSGTNVLNSIFLKYGSLVPIDGLIGSSWVMTGAFGLRRYYGSDPLLDIFQCCRLLESSVAEYC